MLSLARHASRSVGPTRLHLLPAPSPCTAGLQRQLGLTRRYKHSWTPHPHFTYSPEVRKALEGRKPIVALESTIITHGMPFPQNVQTAKEVEGIIREAGVTPATIAILQGRVHIGLSSSELQDLGKRGKEVTKASRRDLSLVCAQGKYGATTVSGTMILAHQAGIPIFATGGIGGVHRGGESNMDISADLTELGRTPVAVVCAGVKSILDIGRTLEYLETQGVSVVTVGGNGEFPAFFTRTSGHRSPWVCQGPEEAASMLNEHEALGLGSGMVFAVPIPKEDEAAGGARVQKAMDQAVQEAEKKGIHGSAITPFLLDRVASLTKGDSLRANIALIKNNARVGAAMALSKAKMDSSSLRPSSPSIKPSTGSDYITPQESSQPPKKGSSMIIGCTAVDIVATISTEKSISSLIGTSHPGRVWQTLGGVGCNMARSASLLGSTPTLLSRVGKDSSGRFVLTKLSSSGVFTGAMDQVEGGETPTFCVLQSQDGEMVTAVSDMRLAEDISEDHVERWIRMMEPSSIAFDGNLSSMTIRKVVTMAAEMNIPAIFEPTSIPKAIRIYEDPEILNSGGIRWVTPNILELQTLTRSTLGAERKESPTLTDLIIDPASQAHITQADLDYIIPLGQLLSQYIPRVLVKLGSHGVLLILQDDYPTPPGGKKKPTLFQAFPAHRIPTPGEIVSTTGAGDSLVGALVAGLERYPRAKSMEEEVIQLSGIIRTGQQAAYHTLLSPLAVSERIHPRLWEA